jgi:hypothetical protein
MKARESRSRERSEGETMSIEQSGRTEEMRHVPPVDVLVARLQSLRISIDVLSEATRDLADRGAVDAHLTSAGRWFSLVETTLRHKHGEQGRGSGSTAERTLHSLDHALQALRSADRGNFRRRSPFHLFERSRGETVVAAVAAAECHVNAAVEAASSFVTDIHWRVASRRDPIVPVPDRIDLSRTA